MQTIDGTNLVELAYRFDPSYWGKGLAVEAAAAIVEYGFRELHLDQVIAIIDPQNKQSVRVAAKIGMHYWKDSVFHEIPVRIYRLSKIVVNPFHSSWARSFDEARKQLKEVFGSLQIEFFHIGSTSIPGCSAKPVIDILGVTSDILQIDGFDQAMIERGFKPLGEYGMKQRRFFQRKDGIPINLHIFEESDPEVNRHLRFCHYLREHPDRMRQYSSLKETLAKRYPHDIQSYILGKERLIKEIDMLAAWEAPIIEEKGWECKKSEWTEREIKSAMQVNMHLHMTYFAKYVPTMDIVFEPDVTVVRSQIQDDTFNYVISARFTERNMRDRVRHVKSLFQRSKLPFSWWVAETDSPANLWRSPDGRGILLEREKRWDVFEIKGLCSQNSS
ncbi:MAG: GNAT family N-acetyltransferase, partial [Chlamydiae bacterium]|nr:GNAT family N-acetyltransferase [Chlamydiota bacterium]